jgi:hypothetical protein
MAMTHEEVWAMALSFPQTEEAISYGKPSFKAFGKFLTRLRSEDQSLVLHCTFDEREMLMEAEPETFHITPHYKDYPSVLARIATVDPGTVRSFLERRWRQCAPKTFLKQFDAAASDRAGARP